MPNPHDPEPRDPLPSLETLQEKIDSAKVQAGLDKQAGADDAPRTAGDAMKIGIELVSGVAVGGFAGFFLDRWLHTMPLFFIVCLLLGAVAGFRNMIREANKTDNR